MARMTAQERGQAVGMLSTGSLLRQAFQRTQTETDIPGVKLKMITDEYFSSAIEFANEVFPTSEPVSRSLGWSTGEEAQNLWVETFRKKLSLMLVDETTGTIIGMRACSISKAGKEPNPDDMKDPLMKQMTKYSTSCFATCDFFNHYGTGEIIEFFGLGIASSHRRQGLGTKLMGAALKFLKYLNVDPLYVRGGATSNYSKRIYEKYGFDVLSEHPFSEYKVDGEVVIKNTGEHKSLKVYGKRL